MHPTLKRTHNKLIRINVVFAYHQITLWRYVPSYKTRMITVINDSIMTKEFRLINNLLYFI